MEGAPPVANQIELFMHFLGASRDGLVARRVDLDTISSSDSIQTLKSGQRNTTHKLASRCYEKIVDFRY
jgi:hypothetical protein